MYRTRMCGAAVSVLLFLVLSLVEVHSQTAPYLTFMGETLPNHSYCDLSALGEIDNEDGQDNCPNYAYLYRLQKLRVC